MNYFINTLVVSLLFVSPFAAESVCGDWETYREEKCIKLITTVGLQSFADAEKTCAANDDSKLVSILNAHEQDFVVDYLFTKHSVVNNVWLGARYSFASTSFPFHWDGGKNMTFTNWAPKNPKNTSSPTVQTCIQMHAEAEIRGQWSNEPCNRQNQVVCEKRQTWTLNKMQELIERLMLNQVDPVPLGFIYVQLPKEKSPQEIWPNWMTWSDVSDQYDSTFFRVAGNKAAGFGAVQEEFSPYIDEIKYRYLYSPSSSETIDAKISRNGGWTGDVYASHSKIDGDYHGYLNFHTAAGEVRPRNMAVKVWKRTG